MPEDDLFSLFIVEAGENLQAVEEGLLGMETNPADHELINVVFRAMHSIKGGAGMVGLGQVNLLAHRLENILDKHRQSENIMSEEALNLLFAGTDLLRQMLEGGEQASETLTQELEELLQMLNLHDADNNTTDDKDTISLGSFVKVFEKNMLEAMLLKGKTICLINVTLSQACLLKSVRAYMVLKAVDDIAEIIKIIPSPEDLETENFDSTFALLAAGKLISEEVTELIGSVSEIESVQISSVSIEEALKMIAEAAVPPQQEFKAPLETPKKSHGPCYFRIELKCNPQILESGIDPLMFIVELGENGRILESYVNISQLPRLETLKTKSLHISWTLFFESRLNKAQVEEIFSVLREENNIKIDDITDEFDLWFSGDKRTGELLVERGLISPDDIEMALQRQKRIGELLAEEGKVTGMQVQKAIQVQQQFQEREQADTIRVDTRKLEDILNYVAELLISQSRVKEMTSRKDAGKFMDTELTNAFQDVDKIIRMLQEEVMNASMIPIGATFVRFQRMARDLAKELGKEVDLVISGRETELDKKVIEQITDPLKHLIRNCVDHGLELPDQRKAAGKPSRGTINLNAFHQEGHIVIEIIDDGRGIDEAAVLAKAREKGLVEGDRPVSASEIQRMIFLPGFSTAKKISDVSGRGVGLDVVMTNIQNLRGSIDLFSEKNKGTKLSIKLPLTLAIIDGMMVRVGEERFIIPLTSIIEFIKAKPGDIHRAEGKGMILPLRKEYIPYKGLFELLHLQPEFTNPSEGILVILKEGPKKMALLVDDIIGQEQVVIKSMREHMEQVQGIAGATILGNGKVAIILDIASLFRMSGESADREKNNLKEKVAH